MKTIKLLLLAVIFTINFSTAQDILKGKVLDDAGIPIPFATITISAENASQPAVAKLTDIQGNFQLNAPILVAPILTITEVAHETLTIKLSALALKNKDTLIFVMKQQLNTLNSVTVSARKRTITQKIDRLVMNLGNNSLTAGKSSLEILSMAPGVFVNNGTIAINGNAGTRVMVNGKILQLSGDDLSSYLNNLRADDMESIEVIAHPPAEYEAQGTGGMLNIILKKQTANGFNGTIQAGYTQDRYAGTNKGLALNFKSNRLTLFTNYSFNQLKSYEDSRMERQNIHVDYQFKESANRVMNNHGHRLTAGAIYDISPKQYIGIDYAGNFNKRVSTYQSVAEVDDADDASDRINTGTYPLNNKTKYNNAGINYHLNLDTLGSSLVLLTDYTHNDLETASAANSSFFTPGNEFLSDTSFRNTTPSIASIYTADARYTKVYRNSNSWNGGIKGAWTTIDNSSSFESLSNEIWKNNPEQDYIYNYQEHILAAYLNFSGKIIGTEVKLGMRTEYTKMSGNLVTSALLNEKSYFNLFPSIFMKRAINEEGDNYLSGYYGRRLSRPSYGNLNPYEAYINNYSIGKGNPYLTPAYSNAYEIGLTLRNKYIFKVSYQKDKDLIAEFIKPDDNNPLLWVYSFQNFGENKNISLSANIPVEMTKWWSTSTNIEFRHQTLQTPDLQIKKGLVYLQSNHDFRLSAKTSINLSGYYLSNLISGNLLLDALYTFNIGAQHKLLKKQLTIKASVTDPLYLFRIKGNTVYRNYTSTVVQQRQTRTVNLSATYNFSLGKTFKTKKLEKSSQEEEKRL